MGHHLTILAYEMNGAPVSILHGAPLRLRCENELGFKQVEWIEAIEFVQDFAGFVADQGGYNKDSEFFGYRMHLTASNEEEYLKLEVTFAAGQ